MHRRTGAQRHPTGRGLCATNPNNTKPASPWWKSARTNPCCCAKCKAPCSRSQPPTAKAGRNSPPTAPRVTRTATANLPAFRRQPRPPRRNSPRQPQRIPRRRHRLYQRRRSLHHDAPPRTRIPHGVQIPGGHRNKLARATGTTGVNTARGSGSSGMRGFG